MAAKGLDFPAMVDLLVGDVARLGFPKPDHEVGQTHPVMNTQLLYNAAHGRITPKGDVERFDGDKVVFKDGTRETIDVVICATGYAYRAHFLDEQAFGWQGEHPRLYMTAFSRQHPTLFFFGLFEAGGAPWVLNGQMALIVADYLKDRRTGSPRAEAFRRLVVTEEIDLQEGGSYLRSDRTVNYIHIPAYEKHVNRLLETLKFTRQTPGLFDSLALDRALDVAV